MSQNRKYFGMTSAQVGILVVLGAVACILFAFTGWFMLGGSVRLPFSKAPGNTPTPQLTPTIFVLPTITPTITPTPVPYEQLIPNDWKQFKSELVEIWLPPSFKVANKSILGDTTGLAIPELVMSGAVDKSSLYKMIVGVSYEPLVGDSLDAYLDGQLAGVSQQSRLVERRKVSVNSTEAVRLMFEIRVNNTDINDLTYVFQDGGTVWYVEYAAQINEYYEMLPLFEQSAETFRIVR